MKNIKDFYIQHSRFLSDPLVSFTLQTLFETNNESFDEYDSFWDPETSCIYKKKSMMGGTQTQLFQTVKREESD